MAKSLLHPEKQRVVCGKHPKQSGHFAQDNHGKYCNVWSSLSLSTSYQQTKHLKCVFQHTLQNCSAWLGDSTMSKYSTVKVLRGRRQFDVQQLFWLESFLNCAIKLGLKQYILMQSPKKSGKKQHNIILILRKWCDFNWALQGIATSSTVYTV